MKAKPRVRTRRPADAAVLRSLALAGRDGYAFEPDLPRWRWDVLDRPGSTTLVAEDDAGRVVLAFVTLLADGTVASCGMDLSVDAELARMSVATLMQAAEDVLRGLGATRVCLRLDEAHPMTSMLESLGYGRRPVDGPQWMAPAVARAVSTLQADPWTHAWSMAVADYR